MKEDVIVGSVAHPEAVQTSVPPVAQKDGGGAWFRALVEGTKTLGKASVALVNRLRGVRDPEAAINELDGQLAATRAKREPLSIRYEKLYSEIAAKKKIWQTAAPVRKKMLELELKTLLAEYKGAERELAVLFEHERLIVTVRARTLELAAQGLALPKVEDVDRLTDDIDNAVDEAEDVSDAVSELENAGVRRERNSVNLEDALAAFDEPAVETDASRSQKRETTPLEN